LASLRQAGVINQCLSPTILRQGDHLVRRFARIAGGGGTGLTGDICTHCDAWWELAQRVEASFADYRSASGFALIALGSDDGGAGYKEKLTGRRNATRLGPVSAGVAF